MLNKELSMDRLVNNEQGWISAAIFSHPDVYQQELDKVFGRNWLFVGHESQIPSPGDFVRSRMGEEQVIVTRGRDGRVYVLLNSCAHRGNMVCRYDEGHGLAFQCSFHGWTFGSDGALINLPPGSEEAYAADLKRKSGDCCKRGWKPSRARSGPTGTRLLPRSESTWAEPRTIFRRLCRTRRVTRTARSWRAA